MYYAAIVNKKDIFVLYIKICIRKQMLLFIKPRKYIKILQKYLLTDITICSIIMVRREGLPHA